MLKAVEVTSNITYDKINDIVSAKDAILTILCRLSRYQSWIYNNINFCITRVYNQLVLLCHHTEINEVNALCMTFAVVRCKLQWQPVLENLPPRYDTAAELESGLLSQS